MTERSFIGKVFLLGVFLYGLSGVILMWKALEYDFWIRWFCFLFFSMTFIFSWTMVIKNLPTFRWWK